MHYHNVNITQATPISQLDDILPPVSQLLLHAAPANQTESELVKAESLAEMEEAATVRNGEDFLSAAEARNLEITRSELEEFVFSDDDTPDSAASFSERDRQALRDMHQQTQQQWEPQAHSNTAGRAEANVPTSSKNWGKGFRNSSESTEAAEYCANAPDSDQELETIPDGGRSVRESDSPTVSITTRYIGGIGRGRHQLKSNAEQRQANTGRMPFPLGPGPSYHEPVHTGDVKKVIDAVDVRINRAMEHNNRDQKWKEDTLDILTEENTMMQAATLKIVRAWEKQTQLQKSDLSRVVNTNADNIGKIEQDMQALARTHNQMIVAHNRQNETHNKIIGMIQQIADQNTQIQTKQAETLARLDILTTTSEEATRGNKQRMLNLYKLVADRIFLAEEGASLRLDMIDDGGSRVKTPTGGKRAALQSTAMLHVGAERDTQQSSTDQLRQIISSRPTPYQKLLERQQMAFKYTEQQRVLQENQQRLQQQLLVQKQIRIQEREPIYDAPQSSNPQPFPQQPYPHQHQYSQQQQQIQNYSQHQFPQQRQYSEITANGIYGQQNQTVHAHQQQSTSQQQPTAAQIQFNQEALAQANFMVTL
jgi:hypothetical protein